MANYTETQLELANVLDEIKIGETIELSSDDFIYRRSEHSYILNDEKDSYGFTELHDKLNSKY